MTEKYSQWSRVFQHFSFQGPPNFTQSGIFGLKRNHLAALIQTIASSFDSQIV
jgi:hypothetical protein